MKDIKKLMITLALLLTAVGGAWADGIVCTASDLGKVLCTDGSIYENVSAATTAGKTAAAMIAYVDETNKKGLALALTDEVEMNWATAKSTCEAKTPAFTGGTWKLPTKDEWNQMFSANGGSAESYTGLNTAITTAGGTTLTEDNYWSSTPDGSYAYYAHLIEGETEWRSQYVGGTSLVRACLAFDIASASTSVEVAWDKAEKTGSFTMPGGNVTLEPEYYPQAALTAAPTAINDVPATTDGAIVNAGTVKNIGETTTAQGTVMYYVSPTALDDAALLALAADAWKADVPTAKSLAQGQAYVYYYVRGNDGDTDETTFSDGDILSANAIPVTIAAEPTYAVTFAEGVNPAEPALWTADPATGVKKGQQVTVTYTGAKKVIGVKAEKKERPVFVPGATIQNIESFVEVKNNKDGTITLHMPRLNPSTYNVTNSTISNGEHTLHFGYEMGSGTNMSSIGANIITKSWSDHTPFSELDKTIDITSGMPRVAIMITGHVRSSTCPAPGKEHYWGLYRYTNPVKVTYNLGGGSVSGSTADKVEYLFSGDALATTFAAPTREGYTFDGWYTSDEGGTKLTASNATSATTIYAHWNAIAE